MKKFFTMLALVAVPILAFAYYSPGKATGFVNDFAGILSADQKSALEQKLSLSEKESTNEISVAIIPDLQGDTIENFAVKLFEEWGIGKAKNDNGVLLLIARDDRKLRIEVGYGLEGALTDVQSYSIINSIITPAFREEKYFEGIDKGVDAIILATRGEYVAPSTSGSTGPDNSGTTERGSAIGRNFENLVWFAFFGFILLISILGRSKSWWAGGIVGGVVGLAIGIFKGFLFFGLTALGILVPLGLLLDFIVSRQGHNAKKRGIPPWWMGGGHGGGGFGGGGGGGFGGFGGGRSGGGGASGSW